MQKHLQYSVCVCVWFSNRASGYRSRRIIFSKPAVSRRREFRRAEARRQCRKQCRTKRCQEINHGKLTIDVSLRVLIYAILHQNYRWGGCEWSWFEKKRPLTAIGETLLRLWPEAAAFLKIWRNFIFFSFSSLQTAAAFTVYCYRSYCCSFAFTIL